MKKFFVLFVILVFSMFLIGCTDIDKDPDPDNGNDIDNGDDIDNDDDDDELLTPYGNNPDFIIEEIDGIDFSSPVNIFLNHDDTFFVLIENDNIAMSNNDYPYSIYHLEYDDELNFNVIGNVFENFNGVYTTIKDFMICPYNHNVLIIIFDEAYLQMFIFNENEKSWYPSGNLQNINYVYYDNPSFIFPFYDNSDKHQFAFIQKDNLYAYRFLIIFSYQSDLSAASSSPFQIENSKRIDVFIDNEKLTTPCDFHRLFYYAFIRAENRAPDKMPGVKDAFFLFGLGDLENKIGELIYNPDDQNKVNLILDKFKMFGEEKPHDLVNIEIFNLVFDANGNLLGFDLNIFFHDEDDPFQENLMVQSLQFSRDSHNDEFTGSELWTMPSKGNFDNSSNYSSNSLAINPKFIMTNDTNKLFIYWGDQSGIQVWTKKETD